MNDDAGGRRMRPLRTGLLAIMAGTALLTAACSGGSSSPRVASLGTSSSAGSGQPAATGSSAATSSQGNPTQLLNGWAACMRRHGDANQADPTIDTHGVINITIPPGIQGGPYGTGQDGKDNVGPGQYCRTYLNAAQAALRGTQPLPKRPSTAQLLTFSKCMRANGIPDFPDPEPNGGIVLNVGATGDLNYNSPAFQRVNNLCIQKTGVQGLPGGGQLPPGTIKLDGGNG